MTKTTDVDLLRACKNGNKSSLKGGEKVKLPVLTGILVQKAGERLEMVSTDLETVSRDSVSCYGGDDWGIVIPASNSNKGSSWTWSNPLIDWLRVLEPKKREPVELELEMVTPTCPFPVPDPKLNWDKRPYLVVKAGNIRAKFFGLPAADFPNLSSTLSKFDGLVAREPIAT